MHAESILHAINCMLKKDKTIFECELIKSVSKHNAIYQSTRDKENMVSIL
jgi:hypothetical protein